MGNTSRGGSRKRGLPLLPTLMVLLIVPVLLGFGMWQLQRMHWKEAILASMEAGSDRELLDLGAQAIPSDAAFRTIRVAVNCPDQMPKVEGGRDELGQNGWVFVVACNDAGGTAIQLVLGWNSRPDIAVVPESGMRTVEAVAAPSRGTEWRLTMLESPQPLVPAQAPRAADMPNNHLSYALQWFSFAVILLVIYGLWVKRWREGNPDLHNRSDRP